MEKKRDVIERLKAAAEEKGEDLKVTIELTFDEIYYGVHKSIKMNKMIKADLGFAETLVETLQNLSVTNMTTKRLAEELKEVYGYETLAVDHPEGEYCIGSDGFVEFHMKEGAAVEWVLEHLYTEVKD